MGPKIFSVTRGETVFSLRVFPIGGFCKMLGDEDFSNDQRAFNNKPLISRFLVITAGAFMNILLSLVIFTGMVLFTGFSEPTVMSVVSGSPAEKTGLMPGDKIVRIDTTRINLYEDMTFALGKTLNNPIDLTILRGGEKVVKNITPYLDTDGIYRVGIICERKTGFFDETREGFKKAGIVESIQKGFYKIAFFVKVTIEGVFKMFSFQVKTE